MNWFKKVLRHYADFKGRARRKEYWLFVLFYILFSIGVSIIDQILGTTDPDTGAGLLGSLYYLALLVPSLAVGARRLHDTGRSGWMLLLILIPLIGWVWLLILFVQEGNQGDNQYGSDPKDEPEPV
jgi:uncharacterized membrane protein YhaH (DUF805 family)